MPFFTSNRPHPRPAITIAAALAATLATCTAIAPLADAQPYAPVAKVTGAYLYINKIQFSNGHHATPQPFATLVFKTNHQLPRRFDGLIRAGAGIAGQNASVGSVHGKASRCYQVNVRIKPDNTITGTNAAGQRQQTKARAGSRLHIVITTAKDAPTVTRTLTLRHAKPGDTSGKPLGC
jgi:hypothetical protein